MNHLPLVNALGELNETRGFMDTLAAATEVAVESANLTNRFLKAAKKGQLTAEGLKQFGLGDEHGINPVLGWQLGVYRSSVRYQTLGPGSVTAQQIIAHGGELVFDQGYAVNAEHGIIDVDVLKSNGATLKSSSHSSNTQLEISTSFTGVADVGVSLKKNDITLEQHLAYNNLNFGRLDLNARKVILNNSTVTAEKLTGHVDLIESQSSHDTINQSGYSVSASYGGNFSVGVQSDHSEKMAVPYAFRVKDASEFTCGEMHLTGQMAPGIKANHTQSVPLYDVSHKNQLGFGISMSDFMKGDRASQNVFTPVYFNVTNQNYLARHDMFGTEVLNDTRDHFRVNIPIYHSEAGREFLDNMYWVSSSSLSEQQSGNISPESLVTHFIHTKKSNAAVLSKSYVTHRNTFSPTSNRRVIISSDSEEKNSHRHNETTHHSHEKHQHFFNISTAALASLTGDALKIHWPIVSHTTSLENSQSIMRNGIQLKLHSKCRNAFGKDAFYVSEKGFSIQEARGGR